MIEGEDNHEDKELALTSLFLKKSVIWRLNYFTHFFKEDKISKIASVFFSFSLVLL